MCVLSVRYEWAFAIPWSTVLVFLPASWAWFIIYILRHNKLLKRPARPFSPRILRCAVVAASHRHTVNADFTLFANYIIVGRNNAIIYEYNNNLRVDRLVCKRASVCMCVNVSSRKTGKAKRTTRIKMTLHILISKSDPHFHHVLFIFALVSLLISACLFYCRGHMWIVY